MAMMALGASFAVSALEVEPMLTTRWGQNKPYNNSCPAGTVAGCGPVAIGQILNYYGEPKHGFGVKTYTPSAYGKPLTVDYSTMTMDWDNVIDDYQEPYTAVQAQAVADILYQIGVAMEANYDSSTSINSYGRMLYGLHHYLHLSPDCRYKRRRFYSTPEWVEMINTHLAEGRPVFYRGDWKFNGSTSGHMFVIDGISEDGLYHMNFGHNGRDDKFADLGVVNQSGVAPGNRGVCYNYAQAAIFDCYPTPDCDTYPNQACILEEPIILNQDLSQLSVTVPLGTTFTLGTVLRNISDRPAKITYSWALTKDDEVISPYFNSSTYSLSAGNKFSDYRHQSVYIPKGTADGEYTLYIYTKCEDNNNEWHRVWDSAPNRVDVVVESGKATVTIPDHHAGDPQITMTAAFTEVETWSPSTVPGRTFALNLVNSTSNNYEGPLTLVIETGDVASRASATYRFTTDIALYSNTAVTHHILVPTSKIDLRNKNVTAVSAYYTYDNRELPVLIDETTTGVEDVMTPDAEADASATAVYYNLNGVRIEADRLVPGIYIRRQGTTATKIIIRQ